MQNAVDLDGGYRYAGQRGKQNPAQRIPQGDAKASLQGFDYEFPIVFVEFHAFYLGSLDLYHAQIPSLDSLGRFGRLPRTGITWSRTRR